MLESSEEEEEVKDSVQNEESANEIVINNKGLEKRSRNQRQSHNAPLERQNTAQDNMLRTMGGGVSGESGILGGKSSFKRSASSSNFNKSLTNSGAKELFVIKNNYEE